MVARVASKKHLILFSSIIVIIISMLVVWLHFPLTQNPGSSHGYDCSRMHIYLPTRLDFKGCRTVTGTIRRVKVEPDGDSHALLELDAQYTGLLTSQNYHLQHGYLVVEDTCHYQPSNFLLHVVCLNYRSSLPNPIINNRYEITGNYVIDDWHGSWAEIHGVSELKPLN